MPLGVHRDRRPALSVRSIDSAPLDLGRVKHACLTHDDAACLDKGDSLEQRAPSPHGRWVRGKVSHRDRDKYFDPGWDEVAVSLCQTNGEAGEASCKMACTDPCLRENSIKYGLIAMSTRDG